MRSLAFERPSGIATCGVNDSVHYARHWLRKIGLDVGDRADADDAAVVLVAGDDDAISPETGRTSRIVLWDFHTGLAGSGLQASAAAGVSWVLGHADGPPLALPVDVPEKWCGLVGANLAIASLLDSRRTHAGLEIEVTAADALRSFAAQNAGDRPEIERQWHRNGSVAVEHGGIYPQGFFACRDGHVGIIGRSRKDWLAIREAIGRPAWTRRPEFEDPFALATAPDEVDPLLRAELLRFDRDELLDRAIELGATIAPVYCAAELEERRIVRKDFFDADGNAGLPFRITP